MVNERVVSEPHNRIDDTTLARLIEQIPIDALVFVVRAVNAAERCPDDVVMQELLDRLRQAVDPLGKRERGGADSRLPA